MFILPKEIYRFNEIPVKISMAFITEKEQVILEFIWNCKNTLSSQENIEKEEKAEDIMLLNFKL